MKYQIVIAGFGGQGSVFLVKILALCAGNKNVACLGTENHGMSQRGGAVSCTIKLGDYTNPIIDSAQADLLIGLEKNEALRNINFLKSGGSLAVNAEDSFPNNDLDAKIFQIDAFEKAKNKEFPIQGLNVYMLGVVLAKCEDFPFSLDDVKEALIQFNPKVAQQNIEVLEKAINDIKGK
ncbi:2-oxoacid:acceptor oxidoreductase family protein [Halarcobacter sp.]|uniref:2-oxoacid:acceptor oxidoreductase family protein n=1 Tax=Halarcobacter sp. TaxID=2321133 RepID=UPI002AAACAE0|nr:2-oxoacid:acceptor oxidoreductase family protein [Halarcobacter sp.]